jgi:hypothetical protein
MLGSLIPSHQRRHYSVKENNALSIVETMEERKNLCLWSVGMYVLRLQYRVEREKWYSHQQSVEHHHFHKLRPNSLRTLPSPHLNHKSSSIDCVLYWFWLSECVKHEENSKSISVWTSSLLTSEILTCGSNKLMTFLCNVYSQFIHVFWKLEKFFLCNIENLSSFFFDLSSDKTVNKAKRTTTTDLSLSIFKWRVLAILTCL